VLKKLTVILACVNMLLLAMIFFSGQSIMTYLLQDPIPAYPLILEGFDTFTFIAGPYSPPGTTPIPSPSATQVYWPFYIFAFGIALNVIFIVGALWTKNKQ
jgi:hypothetical protein